MLFFPLELRTARVTECCRKNQIKPCLITKLFLSFQIFLCLVQYFPIHQRIALNNLIYEHYGRLFFSFFPFLIYTKNSKGNLCLIPFQRNVIISFQNILYSLWLNHKSSCLMNRGALLWIIKNSCRYKNYQNYFMYEVCRYCDHR